MALLTLGMVYYLIRATALFKLSLLIPKKQKRWYAISLNFECHNSRSLTGIDDDSKIPSSVYPIPIPMRGHTEIE